MTEYVKNQYGTNTHFIVERHMLDQVIKSLPKLQALALIRNVYKNVSGGYASLEDAQELYTLITGRRPWPARDNDAL